MKHTFTSSNNADQRSFRWALILCSTFLALGLSSCGKNNSSEEPQGVTENIQPRPTQNWVPFDVSDVAILWPKLSGQSFNNLVPVVSQNSGESLVPNRRVLRDLVRFSQGRSRTSPSDFPLLNPFMNQQELVSAPSDSWDNVALRNIRVVSFRIDDCGSGLRGRQNSSRIDKWQADANPFLARGIREQCTPMLRLVAQPPRGDNAVHLIYRFDTEEELLSMVDDLQNIKKASPIPTDGRSLGVHPGLEFERGQGVFSNLVKQFVIKHSKPEKLFMLAFLSTNEFDGGGQWNFFEAQVKKNNRGRFFVEGNPLHALQNSPISQGFTLNDSDPTRNGMNTMANLGQSSLNDLQRSVEAIMDPSRTFNTNLDCKSCHFASQFASHLARNVPDQFSNFFRSADRVFDTPGVTSFPDSSLLPTSERNFRSFGWFEQRPTVNVRVAKKAGAVAASINRHYLGNAQGRGAQCTGSQHRVLRCVLERAGRASDCIRRFCQSSSFGNSNNSRPF